MRMLNTKVAAGSLAIALAMFQFACGDDDKQMNNTDGGTNNNTDGGTGGNIDTYTGNLGVCSPAANWEIWVPRQGANDIKIIAGTSFTVLPDTIDLSATGLVGPHLLEFNADGTKAVVAMLGTPTANYANGGVVVIDTVARTILKTVVTERKTHHAVFTMDGNTVITADVQAPAEAPGSISFVDVNTSSVTKRLDVGGQAVAVALSTDGMRAYVTNQFTDPVNMKSKVHVINVASKEVEGEPFITDKSTVGIARRSDGKVAYVSNGIVGMNESHTIQKIFLDNPDRTAAVETFADGINEAHGIGLGKEHLVVSSRTNGQKILLLDRNGATVKEFPITVASGTALVDWVAMSPDCNTAYVTERTEGKVYPINMTTQAIGPALDLALGNPMANPHGIAVRRAANPDM
jgi:DNA-binding beta-propeller fold protein YncE